jgi:hypothetical protein
VEGSRNDGSGVDRLLAAIRPRWTPERQERIFAAIVERIRAEQEVEEERAAERAADDADANDHDLPPSHYEGGHTHA